MRKLLLLMLLAAFGVSVQAQNFTKKELNKAAKMVKNKKLRKPLPYFMVDDFKCQSTIYNLSKNEEIILREDVEFVSPTNLIIMYAKEIGKSHLLKAVRKYGAEILYEYNIIPGIAIKIPEGKDINQAIEYFSGIKGVTAVERDHIYHLIEPVKPKLEVR